MVIDDALGVARGARGVVEADRVPLIGGKAPCALGVTLVEQLLVLQLAEALAARSVHGVVDVDHQRLDAGLGEGRLDHVREGRVGEQHLRLAVVQDEGDGRGIEPDVEGVEHRAAGRHAVMRFQERRDVGAHDGDRVALAVAAPLQRRAEPSAAGKILSPGTREGAVDIGRAIREHHGRAPDEGKRRQRHMVGGIALKMFVVDGHGDVLPGARSLPQRAPNRNRASGWLDRTPSGVACRSPCKGRPRGAGYGRSRA